MAQGKLTLADLVTQAPLDDDPVADAENFQAPQAAEATAGTRSVWAALCPRLCCRCCRRRRSESKLAAIVPVESPPEHDSRDVAGPTAPTALPEVQLTTPTPAASASGAAAPSAAAARAEEEPAAPVAAAAPVPAPVATAAAAEPALPPPQPPAAAAQEEPRDWGQLGPQTGPNIGRKTLVLDLDETLIHSSFRVVPSADIVIGVELEGEIHHVYVRKRPGVDQLLAQVSQLYEVVVYTASLPQYANKLLDQLDKDGNVALRLFRNACTRLPNGYVKDLSKLGRDLKDVIIVDNSPICYSLQPSNAIPIKTWRDDPHDRELFDLVPILNSLAEVEDVPMVLEQIVWTED
mmetsp:Transcript_57466/g.115137  ORF Transcript_57466/g.115137 Transcript_57466/m.115137 type:complete len:349 (-) Transcript_57466:93-1139(-)